MSTVTKLYTNYSVYTLYQDLLNSYVCDYYVEDHWKKLPRSWQNCCSNISLEELSEILDFSNPIKSKMYSLSILSLRFIIANNVLSRKQVESCNSSQEFENEKFKHLFWKNVKLKKRHEISILAELCYKSALKTDCFCIVDIGSGVGHLSRLLAYKYGFKVCTFEANNLLSKSAKELDNQFQKSLNKYKVNFHNISQPVHINKRITADLDVNIFKYDVTKILGDNVENFKFGIVGLHPCGDLGATLLRLYTECPEATFLNMASCCYMKLTLSPSPKMGFPLSDFGQRRKWILSYLSCEIACHVIENYVNKLKSKDSVQLKIHAYRAALEKLLISFNPKLKHSAVTSIKFSDKLTFKEYCSKAFERFNITMSDDIIFSFEQLINDTWHNVVVFYSIRLLFAPLIETIILLDRILFLQENKIACNILPAFDCNISPRNHVIISRKNINN